MTNSQLQDRNRRTFRQVWSRYGYFYMLLVPAILFYLIFAYIPMGGIIIAFKDYKLVKGVFGSEWAGLANFERLTHNSRIGLILGNTLFFSLTKLVCGFPAPIILALMFNEVRSRRFLRVAQSITYLPHFISWVVLSSIFTQMLSPTTGAINVLIELFGGEPIYFLKEPQWFRFIIVVTDVWKGVGWGTILYLAVITGIDQEMYESARLDGANRWQQAIHLTLPSLASIICIQLIMSASGLLNAGFDQLYNMSNDLVRDASDVLDTWIYSLGLQELDYSLSTAAGLAKTLVSFALLITVNFIVKKIEPANTIW